MALAFQNYNLIGNNFAAGGLNLKYPVTNVADNETPNALNCYFSVLGSIVKRHGFSKLNFDQITGAPNCTGLFQNITSNGLVMNIACAGADIYSSVTNPNANVIKTGQTPGALYDFAAFQNKTFIVNGVDPNLYWNGVSINPFGLGIVAPIGAPVAADNGAGLLDAGSYKWAYTYVNADGDESNPSPYSNILALAANHSALLTNITVSADPQVTARNIYRTLATGSAGTDLFFVGTINNNTATTFVDNVPDANLGRLLEYDNDVPPVLSYIKTHKNRLFGVEAANPNRLRFSKEFNYSSWPVLNSIDVDTNDGDVISGIYPFFDQLVNFKRKSIYVLSGNDETDFVMQRTNTDFRIGCVAFRTIALLNNTLAFLSERGPFAYDGLRVIYIGDKIESIFNKTNPNLGSVFNWIQQGICCATAYKRDFKNWYFLNIPVGSSNSNNLVLVYDFVTGAWQSFDGIYASSVAVFENQKTPYLYSGDYNGFLWTQDDTNSDGFIHNVSHSTSNVNGPTILIDTTQAWVVNAIKGVRVKITAGKGAGQIKTIISNTATQLTVDSPWAAGQTPDTTSEYSIGFIGFEYDTRWINYNAQDLSKRLMYFTTNTELEGSYTLQVCVRFDFQYGDAFTFCQNVPLSFSGSLFDIALFDSGIFDQTSNIVTRLTAPGGHIHRYAQVLFKNDKGNQPVTINSLMLFYQLKGLRS